MNLFKKTAFVAFMLMNFCIYKCYGLTFDTTEVLLNAKLAILQIDLPIKSNYNIEAILKGNCNYNILKNNGFNDIFFFEVLLSPKSADSLNKYVNSVGLYNCNFIFGYNTINDHLYKLKGFYNNDFWFLYKFLPRDHSRRSLVRKKLFLQLFYVEKLDLKCLFIHNKVRERRNYKCLGIPQKLYDGTSW